MRARLELLELLPKGGIGVEVGVFGGDFSELALQVAQPRILHLIDPWTAIDKATHRESLYSSAARTQAQMDEMYNRVLSRFKQRIDIGQVFLHRQTSGITLEELADASLDWVYIDGDHTYDAVINDLRVSARKTKRGGLICGDDYMLGGWWQDGVVRAVHNFLAEMRGEIMILAVIEAQYILRRL
jgi:hypothetical protein